ncbi:SIMPL domain-containing protein [Microbacterium sp. YY-03]|uniref:SIMPL domain-containing protein n=1 Tax=Microbacterium sp. YY-03 TaxID=3421636 RepID=UPI003D166D88
MTDVVINVRGEHHMMVAAELGVARVAVRFDGPTRAEVVEKAQRLGAEIQDELRAAEASGAITKWSNERLSVWADRPWNDKGKQLPLVHHASVQLVSEWKDFSALSEWISRASERDGVTIGGIGWGLTKEVESATEKTVAQGAVQVAIDRATAYAEALGLKNVQAQQIADVGMMSREMMMKGPAPVMMASARGAMADSAPAFELEPEEIEVSATVEARFIAN